MSSPFQGAAQRAGLTLRPSDAGYLAAFDMSGQVAGHVVRVQRDPMMRRLRTEVYFAMPFDLGLKVAPAGQPDIGTPLVMHRRMGRILGKIFGHKDMRIGDAQIDDLFDIHSDEEARVSPLLEAARSALLTWYESGVGFDIDDAHVSVRRYYSVAWGDSPDAAAEDVPAALALAQQLEAARASLPVAAALAAQAEPLRAFVAAHGLGSSTTPLAAWGTVGSFGLLAHVVRTAPEAFELDLSVRWEPGDRVLGGSARATARKGAAPEAELRFDEIFAITDADLSARLPADARDELLSLRRAGHDVVLDDQGLHLRRGLGAEPYPFAAVTDQAIATLRAVESALRPRAAYR